MTGRRVWHGPDTLTDTNHKETPMPDTTLERLCEAMHDAYEAAAVGVGWQTQEASRKPWAEVPEANKATMRAAVAAVRSLIVAEFVGRQSAAYRKHSADAVVEDTVLAIREFGCTPEQFYDDGYGQNWIRAQVLKAEAIEREESRQ